MAAWVCDDCTTVYTVDAPACPQCGATAYHGDWDEQGGASSPGTSSSTSSTTRPRSSTRKSPPPALPAPTTESPSAPDLTGSPTVPSTAGGPESPAEPTSTPDQGG